MFLTSTQPPVPGRRMAIVSAALIVGSSMMAACSFNRSVSADDLSKEVAAKLEESIGERPDVTCEDGLKGEVGATSTCRVTSGDIDTEVIATATSIEGRTINFEINGGEFVPRQNVADQVAAQWEQFNGAAPDSVECDRALAGDVGAAGVCHIQADGEVLDANVTVTEITDGVASFDITPA